MEKWLIIALASSLAAAVPAVGAEVNVLSGGAIEPGLLAAVEAFRKESGHQVNVKFATAPQIRERMVPAPRSLTSCSRHRRSSTS